MGHSAPCGCGRLGYLFIINIRESQRELKRFVLNPAVLLNAIISASFQSNSAWASVGLFANSIMAVLATVRDNY